MNAVSPDNSADIYCLNEEERELLNSVNLSGEETDMATGRLSYYSRTQVKHIRLFICPCLRSLVIVFVFV